MSRGDSQRLEDVLVAIAAIRGHMGRGGLEDGMVFDAVRVRLIEIGEAIKGLSPDLLANRAELPWTQMAGATRLLGDSQIAPWIIRTPSASSWLPQAANTMPLLVDVREPSFILRSVGTAQVCGTRSATSEDA